MGGTLTATILGVFLVPAFYVLVSRIFGRRRAPLTAKTAEST